MRSFGSVYFNVKLSRWPAGGSQNCPRKKVFAESARAAGIRIPELLFPHDLERGLQSFFVFLNQEKGKSVEQLMNFLDARAALELNHLSPKALLAGANNPEFNKLFNGHSRFNNGRGVYGNPRAPAKWVKEFRHLYPMYWAGYDRSGRPILVIKFGEILANLEKLFQIDISPYKESERVDLYLRYLAFDAERTRVFRLLGASRRLRRITGRNTAVTEHVTVLDVRDVPLLRLAPMLKPSKSRSREFFLRGIKELGVPFIGLSALTLVVNLPPMAALAARRIPLPKNYEFKFGEDATNWLRANVHKNDLPVFLNPDFYGFEIVDKNCGESALQHEWMFADFLLDLQERGLRAMWGDFFPHYDFYDNSGMSRNHGAIVPAKQRKKRVTFEDTRSSICGNGHADVEEDKRGDCDHQCIQPLANGMSSHGRPLHKLLDTLSIYCSCVCSFSGVSGCFPFNSDQSRFAAMVLENRVDSELQAELQAYASRRLLYCGNTSDGRKLNGDESFQDAVECW